MDSRDIPAAQAPVSPSAPSQTANLQVGNLYAYYVLVVLFIVYIFNFIDRQILAILLEPIKKDLNISDTALGFLTGFAFAFFYTFAGLPLAQLADRWVRRSLIALSLATWSIMTVLSGFARGFPDLALARIGVGIGEAGASPPAHSILSDYFPPRQRATVLAMYASGIYVGVGIGYWIGGWINDAYGWRMAFFVVGTPGLLLALLVRFTIREPMRGMSEQTLTNSHPYSVKETWRFFISLRTGRYLALAGGLHAFVSYGLGAWIPAFFIRVHHLTTGELGSWLSWITAFGGGAGTFLGGWIADHWGPQQPHVRLYVAIIGVLLAIPTVAASLLIEHTYWALLMYMPAMLCSTLWIGPSFAIALDLAPPAMRAMASAVFLFVVTIIGMGTGPQTVGILNDLIGTPDAIRYSLLSTATIMNLLAAGCFWLAGKTLRQDLEAKTRL
jgi:MFS family permease